MRFLRERRPASPKRDQREGGLPSRPARGILPVLLLVVVLAAPDSVATDRWDSIRAQIRQTMAGANLPSISVAVVMAQWKAPSRPEPAQALRTAARQAIGTTLRGR